MRDALKNISWLVVFILMLTLGLAPFVPEPHIWEKLKMLSAGELRAGIDVFDLFMHGAPFLLAGAKLVEEFTRPTN
jgi:hypothetical protein